MKFTLELEAHQIDVLMPALACMQAISQTTMQAISTQVQSQLAKQSLPPDAPVAPMPVVEQPLPAAEPEPEVVAP
jgi:hypothetical protein